MKLPVRKPGITRFMFVAFLVLFNWPLLSIPEPQNLLGWLFAAWGLAILLLYLAAHLATDKDGAAVQEPERQDTGAGSGGGHV
jgi:hypothetical protein